MVERLKEQIFLCNVTRPFAFIIVVFNSDKDTIKPMPTHDRDPDTHADTLNLSFVGCL